MPNVFIFVTFIMIYRKIDNYQVFRIDQHNQKCRFPALRSE